MKQQHKSQKTRPETSRYWEAYSAFYEQKASKIYNYKQIADGIEYKNQRQRETRFTSFAQIACRR